MACRETDHRHNHRTVRVDRLPRALGIHGPAASARTSADTEHLEVRVDRSVRPIPGYRVSG